MIRNLKNFSLAFIAVAAISMGAATSVVLASELHAAAGPNASIFGTQTTQHVMTIDSGTTKCTQVLFEGTVSSQTVGTTTTQELTVTPQYTGCTAFGLAATIDMNGCEYTITGAGQPALTATLDIVCNKTVGKVIEKTAAAGCVITIPPQTVGGHVVFTNIAGAPADVNVSFTLSGIKYEGHGACPNLTATELTTNGTYTGGATFQARVDTSAAQATHNGHTFQKLLQTGALVALTAT
jgi:hypothetical protein